MNEDADNVARACAALLLGSLVWLLLADTVFQPLAARAVSPTVLLAGFAILFRSASRLGWLPGFNGDAAWVRVLGRLLDGPGRARNQRRSAFIQGAGALLLIAAAVLALVQ